MTDFLWPPLCRQSSVVWRNLSNTEVSPALLSGGLQAIGRPGDRLGCTIIVENSSGAERRKLRAIAAALRGALNPIYVPDYAFKRAGSWGTVAGAEVLNNPDFSNGTTGWAPGSEASISAADGVLRVKRTANLGIGGNAYASQAPTLTVNAPYAWRTGVSAIRGTVNLRATANAAIFFEQDGSNVATPGYRRTWILGEAGTTLYLDNTGNSVSAAGDLFDVSFTSCSRCMLADGGGTLTLRSRELDNAAWTKTALLTVTANTEVAPDGTTTGEGLIPTTSNTSHLVSQSVTVTSASQDMNIRGCFKAGGYNFVLLAMTENFGGTQSFQAFNLQTGAVGTATQTGGNWANLRAAIVSLGNGWYYCSLIVRKTNAATAVTGAVYVESTDSGSGFAGNGTSFVAASDIDLSPSSSHARTTTSTSAAIAASSQSGSQIYVKGLPASQSGLLLEGDAIEIDKQMKFITARVDSDAAGCAFLQFEPALARPVADNTPIFVHNPMCKMRMVQDAEYPSRPGGFSDFRFELVQDLTA